MTKQLTLNCDMGEGFGPWEMGDDKAIMPLIDAANICLLYTSPSPRDS